MDIIVLRGDRVVLRGWEPRDAEPFAAMNADPVVMEHFPAALARGDSDAMMERLQQGLERRGWGAWCLDIDGTCAGFVGLTPVTFEAPFTPCVEIGWRMAAAYWGKGYVTEAARLAVGLGFGMVGLGEIVSFTAVANWRSRRVMERLGMRRRDFEDFDHPRVPHGHPLQRHVLYRLAAGDFK
jgi:RimJ/RimL family protein N-acetyltransferase